MITVSIVTYHTDLDELGRCLASLASECVRRVYVIDNGREDRIRQWAMGQRNVIYIASENRGYGAGHNQALRRVMEADEAPYHLVLNSDVEFEPRVLEQIELFMEGHREVGALQPRIVGADGKRQYTCRALPSPADLLLRRFLPASFFKKSRDRYLLKHLDEWEAHNVPYHQGSFMFLRVDALRQVGIFDERYFMYPEDIDLTRRIHAQFLTLYWPEVTVVHKHRAASYKNCRMLRVHIGNMIKYFNKWGWLRDSERKRMNSEII